MSFNSPLFAIALRQLLAKKRQTILTIAGIGIGVMVLITAISLMDGILQSFVQKIIDNTPHIIIHADKIKPVVPERLIDSASGTFVNLIKHVERDDEDAIKNYQGVISAITSDRRVSFVSPVVLLDEVAVFGTVTLPLKIHGIVPHIENKIEDFSSHMLEGSFENLERTPDGIIVGSTVIKDFPVHEGDRVQLSTSSGSLVSARVIGIFSTGLNEVDNNCYINLRLAQNIGGFNPAQVSKLYARVNDLAGNTQIARGIEQNTNYKAVTWEENAQGFLSLFKMITMIVYFLTFFVILVAGFSVANILITNVLEKRRDIAVMKSIGYKRGEIIVIYTIQALLVAVIGAIAGSLLGYIMIEILAAIPTTGSKSGAVRSDHLAMGRSIWYFVSASGFALLISLIASVGPSRNAANVNPVDILRGER